MKKRCEKIYLKIFVLISFLAFVILNYINFVSANYYVSDIYFTVPDSVFRVNERIEIKGYVYSTNYSDNGTAVSNSSPVANANVNFTIQLITNGTYFSNYTLTTDSNGLFYSKSNYYENATEIVSPSVAGNYYLRAEYKDINNNISYSRVEITIVNQTIDYLKVNSQKAKYNPSETINVWVEAIKLVGDKVLYVNNVSVNGSLRNSSKGILNNFNCVTGSNGKCSVILTAPSSYGDYILELENFKAFSSFSVVPFSFNIYMKDELGQSYKNTYALSEQAMVQVQIVNSSDSDSYSFSGTIMNSSGSVLRIINSTLLNFNNSFTNGFLFTVDSLTFRYGAYKAFVTLTKTGDGSMNASSLFEVKDWDLSVSKKSANSGFEYEYSVFPNKIINLEAYPKYRSNGSLIKNLSASSFTINLKDNLGNIINSTNLSWNSSCGVEGCYEFNLSSPSLAGEYILYTFLSYNGASQTDSKTINVIDGVVSAQSTNKDGDLKELFGTNDPVYISLTAYNSTSSGFNLSDAEIFIVSYMNGSEFIYINVSGFNSVNSTNSVYEWAWNSSLQRLKMDVPNLGGVYNVFIFANNRTMGTLAKFIINPYDACVVSKNTAGTVSSGYYYVWQFQTTDIVYFELKVSQANNPLGRATFSNSSASNASGTHGMGSNCTIDSSKQQAVSNATITVVEVKNTESGSLQSLNTSQSTCQASDSSGGYTCTVKPLSKWEGGVNVVKFNMQGKDGSVDIVYGMFEARAFYLYGWSNVWQNNPSSNITLNVRLYEAGKGWWGGGGSGGLSGTITLKRIEYQGRDGEWIWPPVDSGYNVSNVNSSSITSGSGTLSISASNFPGGQWKTGYYRAVIQGRTSSGESDYGYAWFGVKLWDVYGQPVECGSSSCEYKSYFNSRENITMYIKISKAGDYNYWDSGGSDIYGNVTISIKKIQDCRSWPCKELNSSYWSSSAIVVNSSSPWYWNANSSSQSRYLIYINRTSGTWGTGYYSVVLDVNGTDSGYGWFNTIAFYVSTTPTDEGGVNYRYSIKPSQRMYFNVTTTKGYRGYYSTYNASDFVNTTLDDVILRTWNQTTWQMIEYNYPEDINVTPTSVNGNALLNFSFNSGSWPTGYFYGELSLKNQNNESSTGWLWFEVRPFRVDVTSNNYNLDDDQCVNGTIRIYEPYWYSSVNLAGNYTITSVYEDVWNMGSRNTLSYSNFTNVSFNATANITICPNSSGWGSGSWGGYHYLNIVVRDNSDNSTEKGWLSFRAVPFSISWGSVIGGSGILKNQNFTVPVTITKYSTGANTSGNLTRLYQWRYDSLYSGEEDYVFKVGNCFSNVSGQCTVNGTQNITIYPSSRGWKTGYNYIYAVWTKQDNPNSIFQDWSGIYVEGREPYSGWFDNRDASDSYWKADFSATENLTIKLRIYSFNYSTVDVNITNVYYAYSGSSCWDEWCRSYSAATWSLIGGGSQTNNGNALITIKPAAAWPAGYYYIKATVSGSDGTSTITGGNMRVKDFISPNITNISSPLINQTITGDSFWINFTTTEAATCYMSFVSYDNFYNWYCGGWNSTNSSNGTVIYGRLDSCNATKYGFNGSTYYYEYLSKDYHSASGGPPDYLYWYRYGSSGFVTDGLNHYYRFYTTNKLTGNALSSQDYGLAISCYDSDWNGVSGYVAFKINITPVGSLPLTINSPMSYNIGMYNTSNITFNFTLNANGSCKYSLNNGTTNYTMSTPDNRSFYAINSSVPEGNNTLYAYCNDSSGNTNTTTRVFTIDLTNPLISYAGGTANDSSVLNQTWIYVNVSVTEINLANITFLLWNSTSQVNSTTFSYSTNINWTNLTYGNYTYNVTIYDKALRVNSTTIRRINLSV